jgi:predicted TPR repeat methyltransferase
MEEEGTKIHNGEAAWSGPGERSVGRREGTDRSSAHLLDRDEALALAMRLHRGGNLDDAETIYGRILATAPHDADALHYLGILRYQRGSASEAIALIRRAIESSPEYVEAHNNLGNILQEAGRIEEAAVAYRRALDLRPDDAPTQNNLAVALRSLGHIEDAIALHRRAIALAPRYAEGHFSLGKALRQSGHLDEAIEAFRAAIDLEPTHDRAYTSLGRLLHRVGRDADAVRLFDGWLKQDPRNPVALHMRAACSGVDVPARASDGYVEHVFDTLARAFDENLSQLQYRAPQLTIEALAADAGAPRESFDVLDAGCGTGLCGPLLRPFARHLVGVDLSGGMLAKARGRGVYDELFRVELTAYLASQPQAFDVIVSADTLVYFGDLERVLAAAASALRAGGRLIFTVESADHDDAAPRDGYRINASGRYSHREAYLRKQLATSSLTVRAIASAVLRQEGGSPVAGYVVAARKP